MLLPAALTWMMWEDADRSLRCHAAEATPPTQLWREWDLTADILKRFWKNLSFRFQNNFILQIRKLRLRALELLTLGYIAGLGLCFVRTETNSETKQGVTVEWRGEEVVHKRSSHIKVQLVQGWQITPRVLWAKKREERSPGKPRSCVCVCVCVCMCVCVCTRPCTHVHVNK